MSQSKNAIFLQGIDSFVSGILTVALPLLMLERGIDILSIGLIYAVLPIIFQVTRFLFAILSDFIGRKIFFLLNGISRIFYTAIYYFSFSPLEFLFGKIVEGASSASIWSVNRAFIIEQAKEKWKTLAKLRVFDYISEALGTFVAGFLIIFLFYSNTLIFCIIISFISIPLSLKIVEKKARKFEINKIFEMLNLEKKSIFFKKALLAFFILGLSLGLTAYYIFPLFLKENGYGTELIGMILGIQTFIAGISINYFLNKLSFKKIIVYSTILYFSFLILLCFLRNFFAGLILIFFGIPLGILTLGTEAIFSKVTTNNFAYGTDIGLLMTTFHAGRTISLALSGFLISFYGFSLLFLLSAFIFLFYTLILLKTFER